jgi:hypothetical protein
VIDLATRASRSVTFDPYPDAMFPSAGVAVFDGRYVVTGFITRLGGSTGVSVSLFIYDLNTDSWFPFLHETNLERVMDLSNLTIPLWDGNSIQS